MIPNRTHNPAAPSHCMIGVADYPHRSAGHCGSGALRDLLEWAGLSWDDAPLDEGTAFGLGGDLSFNYIRGAGLGSPFYLVGRGPDLTDKLCRRLGIAVEVHATDDPDQGRSRLLDELAAGRPLLCWADMRELPYLRVRMHMSRHDIVVTGYDPATDQVRVVDNDRADPQLIPAAALAAARASTGFPQPTRHTSYAMRFPDTLPERSTAASSAAADTVDAMHHPPSRILAGPAGVAGAGLEGVTTFAEDFGRWPELFPTASTDATDLHTALMTLAVFIEKAGTGGALFRRLQAAFLSRLAATDPAAAPAARAYRDLAAHWTTVAVAASDSDAAIAPQRWQTTNDLISELPRREADALTELQRFAERSA
ncbi:MULTISPECIES: BtrH N-terminal domain-containing protein [unclassified Pseudonocardia]|uniref:BtrH N-terminal domain-containing protein n=1 Tax=unclassified Pseudonocardia TaxID=2619320 RepID=UPI00095F4159|nr:BtrH N-terminal domain-containing protein [Pseudonocardia sp. Ae707_Ps1]OLM09204.1 hypothetical protein Ae707Ps1_6151c [Pseudonocardia sp. Ae707_Ps1]